LFLKGNISASEWNKLISPGFQFEKEVSTQLLTAIMNMLIRIPNRLRAWNKAK
jgi:hypothetical protein